MTQYLWIPGRLPGLNEILDARGIVYENKNTKSKKRFDEYAKMKIAWSERIKAYALQQRFRRVDFAAFAYLFVEQDRRRDPSNFVGGGLKIFEDALQEAELLTGDGWSNVLAIVPHWIVGSPIGVMVGCGETAPSKDELVAQWERRKVAA